MDRKRVLLLGALFLLPLAGLEARLVHLQILSHEKYVADLTNKRRSLEIAPAPRGRILDRAGKVLAEDRRAFELHLVLEEFEKEPGAVERLALALDLPTDSIRQGIEKIYRRIEEQMDRRPRHERLRILAREKRTPYLLVRDLQAEVALTIETSYRFPGAVVREGLRRNYPFRTAGCHLVGYLGKVGSEEYGRLLEGGYFTEGFEEAVGEEAVAHLVRKGVFLEETVGREGAEKNFNEALRGKCGLVVFAREPGRPREVEDVLPVVPGKDVDLTIDIGLQQFVEKVLEAAPDEAAAVVLDPRSGEIFVLASNRLFDPNRFTPPAKASEIRDYLDPNGSHPLRSRAFAEQYPLGSIFKIVTATSGLENGLVDAEKTIECHGKFKPNLKHFNCHIWNNHQGTHGSLTLRQAMEVSCNIFFYTLGEQMGVAGLRYWALQYGLGQKTGLDLPGEAAGQVPDRQQYAADALSLAIGQQDLRTTPLQVAVLLSVVANGGKKIVPHLRRGVVLPPEPTVISPATIEEIRRGLSDVVHGERGTAKDSGLRECDVAGKTSSAQSGKSRDGKELPTHAWFAGYAPRSSPKYVLVVFIKHGGHGGETAAKMAAQILKEIH